MTQEYKDFVMSKCKPGEAILSELSPVKAHLLHMAIGMYGELDEYFAEDIGSKALEELGDILFYVTGVESIVGTATVTSVPDLGIDGAIHTLGDKLKKLIIYNKPISDREIREAVANVKYVIERHAVDHSKSLEDLMQINMYKLNKRYPSNYSDQAAIARADETGKE